MKPTVIAKVTGHVATVKQAADLRYLDETESRGQWGFSPLDHEGITALIGKQRRIFIAGDDGKIVRLPAEIIPTLDRHGIMRGRRSGTISSAYATRLEDLRNEGKTIYQRIVLGRLELRDDHGYILARPRGTVVPLTFVARIKALELGLGETLSASVRRQILSQLMRESIPGQTLSRRAVKSIASSKKAGKTIAAHNLTIAPHPRFLDRIRTTGQPVDTVLELAARRAVEQIERRIGGKITAVCSTHLQDSTNIRPHLHIRMSACDSNGKYVRLFDKKGGKRCLLQPEIERQITRIIERCEPRGRE